MTLTPLVSVVICTHNRARYLPAAIESLLAQDLDPTRFEILVVDNRSTDQTREIVAGFGARVQYIHEPVLGLSHARNAGWRNARAGYVALLDDDAVAGTNWLTSILAAFETVRPEPGCVGGPIVGLWEAPRPAWLSAQLLAGLAIIDWSPTPHALVDLSQEWLAGANLAVPRALLEQVGGFVDGLDRSGTRLLSSGDVYLQKQVRAAGRTVWYDPRVSVGHHIAASRLDPRWFRRRYYAQGLSDAVMHILEHDLRGPARARAGLREVTRLLSRPTEIAALLRRADDPAAFTAHCFALIRLGHIAGLLGAV